jgi:hypothetical protein
MPIRDGSLSAAALLVAVASTAPDAYALLATADSLAYPPMHWHSWNTFCGEDEVNETNMREMAEAVLSSGLAAAGYDTLNVVCNGWTGRDPQTSRLTENRTLWPNGIKALGDYLHSNGLKLGCYTSPATVNCCGEPGSLGYEDVDMQTFADWGCDHVMVDWCRDYHNPRETRDEYARIGAAIAKTNRTMAYVELSGACMHAAPAVAAARTRASCFVPVCHRSIALSAGSRSLCVGRGASCNNLPCLPRFSRYGIWPMGVGKSWKWSAAVGGNYWRTAMDIRNEWDSVLYNFDTPYSVPNIDQFTSPGHFTFLDQMVRRPVRRATVVAWPRTHHPSRILYHWYHCYRCLRDRYTPTQLCPV